MEQSNEAVRPSASTLRWLGDNISFDASRPATIEFEDANGKPLYLSLAEALARAEEVDNYGLGRIVAGAGFAAERGYLCTADAESWRRWRLHARN
ncbi:hypothetical protein [Cupriavidus nantongensis]|uniref:Uncharacterized protein n=1 Tax=Cupriavidus nantongensis TaxID=1796606 RepID=A0A142JGQ9_9BURK|nr:hypothetical protein [Cupriavidus nantongensis]AMR77271.1 hypothetical protein A2G96_05735 [Cupriavidus nantongensis]